MCEGGRGVVSISAGTHRKGGVGVHSQPKTFFPENIRTKQQRLFRQNLDGTLYVAFSTRPLCVWASLGPFSHLLKFDVSIMRCNCGSLSPSHSVLSLYLRPSSFSPDRRETSFGQHKYLLISSCLPDYLYGYCRPLSRATVPHIAISETYFRLGLSSVGFCILNIHKASCDTSRVSAQCRCGPSWSVFVRFLRELNCSAALCCGERPASLDFTLCVVGGCKRRVGHYGQ